MSNTSPLANALAVWHMSEDDPSATTRMVLNGAVQLGVDLIGSERKASIARGGNGQVAVFAGGYITVKPAGRDVLCLQGDAMSFCMRLRDPTGRWEAPLFSHDDPANPLSAIFYGTDGAAKPLTYARGDAEGAATPYYHLFAEEGGPQRLAGSKALLEYRWRTAPTAAIIEFCERSQAGDAIRADARNGVLTIGAPVELVGPTAWHDVVFRFAGPNLELFVDGVLLDEEWGYGSLYRFAAPFLIGAAWEDGQLKSGFHGQIDHVALWNRALSNDEVAQLSGGKPQLAQREIAILGPKQSGPNYWRPEGYNTYAGDCMLLWDDERLHLFYLFDRRHHTSKWNLGAHQYAHLSTTDLVHWERHPLAVPLDQSWECAIGTGDFIYHNGQYTVFYTDCGGRCQFEDKPHQGSGIFRAASTDGIHYSKEPRPVVPTTDTGCADCSIFHDDVTGLFHLLSQDRAEDGALIVTHYMSSDLSSWARQPRPFIDSGTFGPCPHLFVWNDWYYFAMTNKLWKANSLQGPWESLQPEPLVQLYYPKTAPFKDNRFIMAGWVAHAGWGGDLVFRELVQHQDGRLGAKFPPEMMPDGGPPLDLALLALAGESTWDGDHLRVKAEQSGTVLIAQIPANVRIKLRVEPECATLSIGLTSDDGRGLEVHFDLLRQRVSIIGPLNLWRIETENPVLEPVADLDHPFDLDIIVKNGIIDVCIDQRHTLIARRAGPAGNQLRANVQGGIATFSGIEVCPLSI